MTNMTNKQIIDRAIETETETENRQIEAAGHAATIAYLSQQESDDICAWFERCRPVRVTRA